MAGLAAILVIATALLAAPLALGSYVVLQGTNRRAYVAWFGLLTALCTTTLAVGAVALVFLSFS
jgi:hypothetical protein